MSSPYQNKISNFWNEIRTSKLQIISSYNSGSKIKEPWLRECSSFLPLYKLWGKWWATLSTAKVVAIIVSENETPKASSL